MPTHNKDSEPDAIQHSTSPSGITTIILNRPSRRNAVNIATAQKLYDAFISFDKDDTQSVCVFSGANSTFCAGADLHEIGSNDSKPSDERPVNMRPVEGANLAPMGPSRLTLSKPVIAAVSGYAVAGGLELSLIADMRIAEDNTVFGVFCRRWGVPLIDGGTVRLPKIVGLGRAMDMILTGRPVNAREALEWGLVNRVVPVGKSFDAAMELAKELLKWPQGCMRADRASAYFGMYEASSFQEAMINEFNGGFKVLETESVAGAARFSSGEGRHGDFSGGPEKGNKL